MPTIQNTTKIFLNPQDRALVGSHIESLPAEHPAKNWPLHDEPSLARGDCRLQGRDSHLSADLTRLAKEMVKR